MKRPQPKQKRINEARKRLRDLKSFFAFFDKDERSDLLRIKYQRIKTDEQ